jgi:hypothetical protein
MISLLSDTVPCPHVFPFISPDIHFSRFCCHVHFSLACQRPSDFPGCLSCLSSGSLALLLFCAACWLGSAFNPASTRRVGSRRGVRHAKGAERAATFTTTAAAAAPLLPPTTTDSNARRRRRLTATTTTPTTTRAGEGGPAIAPLLQCSCCCHCLAAEPGRLAAWPSWPPGLHGRLAAHRPLADAASCRCRRCAAAATTAATACITSAGPGHGPRPLACLARCSGRLKLAKGRPEASRLSVGSCEPRGVQLGLGFWGSWSGRAHCPASPERPTRPWRPGSLGRHVQPAPPALGRRQVRPDQRHLLPHVNIPSGIPQTTTVLGAGWARIAHPGAALRS